MKSNLAGLAVFLIGGCAFGSPVGTLGIGSSGNLNATLTSLLFTSDGGAIGPCPGAPCNGDANTGTTLTFVGGPLQTREGILINNGQPFGTPPPPGAGVFNPFFQFAAHPNLLFTLTGVDAGSSNTNCVAASIGAGGSCSINVAGTPSPVVLTKIGTATQASIGIFGTATDGTGVSDWSGAFSAVIPSITPEGILLHFCPSGTCTAADVAAGRPLVMSSLSGTFDVGSPSTTVPEPGMASMLVAGVGLMLLGAARRKRPGCPKTVHASIADHTAGMH